MPNSKYLDPRWQKFRLKKLNKAKWKCEMCKSKEQTLHVHHSYYVSGRDPWDYPTGNTQVLCDDCHSIAHEFDKDISNWERLAEWGFESARISKMGNRMWQWIFDAIEEKMDREATGVR